MEKPDIFPKSKRLKKKVGRFKWYLITFIPQDEMKDAHTDAIRLETEYLFGGHIVLFTKPKSSNRFVCNVTNLIDDTSILANSIEEAINQAEILYYERVSYLRGQAMKQVATYDALLAKYFS